MLYSELPKGGPIILQQEVGIHATCRNLVVVVRLVLTWVVKRATSFFNSFCGHALRQVACFCYSYYRILSKQCIVSLNCCNLDLQLDVAAIKYPSEIITLCITVEYLSYNTRTSPATAWLAPKKGAIFRLIYFLQSFDIDHIPNHYSFRKQCHTAIPQTYSTFYPQRFFGGNQAVVFLILQARLRRERASWSVLTVH